MYYFPGFVKFDECDGAIYVTSDILENTVRLFEPAIIDEVRQIQHNRGVAELSTPLTKFLHEQELLLNQQEVDAALQSLREYMGCFLPLTIMPTEACNFRCPYCYQGHDAATMSQATLDRILEYIRSQASRFPHIQINWFGGEPTLGKNLILKASDYIHRLQEEIPFHFTATMSSNGYLLDVESFKQYYKCDITRYMITLDGWGHDKTRPHASGAGTLDTILDNLVQISHLDPETYDFSIILRHNVLKGDTDYSWYDHLYQLFGHDPRFSVMIRPVGNWGGDIDPNLPILSLDERNQFLLKHIDYVKKIGMPCENGQSGMFSKICHVSYPHSLVFRPNGKIEKCTVILDHPKNLVGHVDEREGVILDEDAIALWNRSTLKTGCHTCPDVAACLNMQCVKDHILGTSSRYACSREESLIY